MSLAEIKSTAIQVPYDSLFRYNEKYVGGLIYFRGQVIQATSAGGPDSYVLRVATRQTSYGSWFEDVIWVNYVGPRVLEKDIVDVWGRVAGLRSYKAVLGQEVTIPEVDSLHLEFITHQESPAANLSLIITCRSPFALGVAF
jgi:hypothetical protein